MTTPYTLKQLKSIKKRINTIKMEAAKAQDYEGAADLRGIEKHYLELIKIEEAKIKNNG
jgi:hypothetical protein